MPYDLSTLRWTRHDLSLPSCKPQDLSTIKSYQSKLVPFFLVATSRTHIPSIRQPLFHSSGSWKLSYLNCYSLTGLKFLCQSKCISYTGWICLHLRECFLLTDSETERKKFKRPKNITENRKGKAAKKKKETHSLRTLRTQFLEIPPGHGPWQHLAAPYVAVNILSLNLRHIIWSSIKQQLASLLLHFIF